MANIEPNSVIRLLNNVPLDNKYTDTLYWENASHQMSNMVLQTKYTFTQQTYQRVNKNRLRIQRCADDIYDCNYLMFQNTAFGNKWFYAFIVKVEYINNITSEIEYEIDDMQTWLFDYTLRPCFVEREHINEDKGQDLLKPEPIDIDLIVTHSKDTFKDDNGNEIFFTVLISYIPWEPFHELGQVIGNNMYSGCNYKVFTLPNQLQDLQNWISILSVAQLQENILGITVFPGNYYQSNGATKEFTHNVERPTQVGSYTPRNKKLLYYPYIFLTIDTGNDSRNYNFDLFSTGSFQTGGLAKFVSSSYVCDNPEISVYPFMYNGYSLNDEYNTEEKVVMRDFPSLTWRSDGYASAIGSLGKGLIQGGIDLGVRGMNEYRGKSLISNFTSGLVDALSFNVSSKMNGANGTSVDIALGKRQIRYEIKGVTVPRAKQIDAFFDRYGYACEQIKVPNRNVRENWTYCKTKDCNIIGSIPVDSMANIKNIYNNGITWWKAIGDVGNYSLSNRTLLEIENE